VKCNGGDVGTTWIKDPLRWDHIRHGRCRRVTGNNHRNSCAGCEACAPRIAIRNHGSDATRERQRKCRDSRITPGSTRTTATDAQVNRYRYVRGAREQFWIINARIERQTPRATGG